jgi:hypothetical protein
MELVRTRTSMIFTASNQSLGIPTPSIYRQYKDKAQAHISHDLANSISDMATSNGTSALEPVGHHGAEEEALFAWNGSECHRTTVSWTRV